MNNTLDEVIKQNKGLKETIKNNTQQVTQHGGSLGELSNNIKKMNILKVALVLDDHSNENILSPLIKDFNDYLTNNEINLEVRELEACSSIPILYLLSMSDQRLEEQFNNQRYGDALKRSNSIHFLFYLFLKIIYFQI